MNTQMNSSLGLHEHHAMSAPCANTPMGLATADELARVQAKREVVGLKEH